MPTTADDHDAHATASAHVGQHPMRRVEPRHSVDYVMRTTQQNLVTLTGQADLKASIVITTSSILLSIGATQWNDADLRWGIGALAVGVTLALFMAVLAVFPKYSVAPPRDVAFPDDGNPLFFGHAALVTKDRYMSRLAASLEDDYALYEMITTDIYQQSYYLLHGKFRYLKLSYLFLVLGVVAALIAQVVSTAT
ncbi:MAG: DUF5706 domain-containing protein [Acidimicrobiales bacterium]